MLRKMIHAGLLFVLVLSLFVGALAAQDSDGHDDEPEATPEAMAEEDAHDDKFVPQAFIDALTIGDPERGEELFNTPIEGLGLTCAGCHRADSTDMLVGPGLLQTAALGHDHATGHDTPAEDAEATPEATTEPMANADGDHEDASDGHGDANNDNEDASADHDDGATTLSEEELEAMAAERVEYIYTAIVDPNAFVAEGMPANVMPQNFGEVLTEQDINDLVAYIVSLSWGTLEDIEAAQVDHMDDGEQRDDHADDAQEDMPGDNSSHSDGEKGEMHDN